MSETSRLSHAMLKVPSVDAAVADWTSKGGRVVYESLNKTKKKTTTQNADETEKQLRLGRRDEAARRWNPRTAPTDTNSRRSLTSFPISIFSTKRTTRAGRYSLFLGEGSVPSFGARCRPRIRKHQRPTPGPSRRVVRRWRPVFVLAFVPAAPAITDVGGNLGGPCRKHVGCPVQYLYYVP